MAFSLGSSVPDIPSLLVFLFVVSLSFLIYASGLACYRLFLHPLSKFPGPKLAAVTLWYEFYYDVVLGGRYTFQIGHMHQKYGAYVPVIASSRPGLVWLHGMRR